MDDPSPAARPRLADQDARDRIRERLDATLVVEAAAGTGKTTELVSRMVALLAAGRGQLDRMAAMTFTDAAAGELKLRLRGAIETARLDPSRDPIERRRLTDSLPQLEEARIGTIHSFCADLLRERPVAAGVDPAFDVIPEDEAQRILDRVFDRWFERTLDHPGEGVRRILRHWKRDPAFFGRRTRPQDQGPRAMLRQAARALVDRRDFPAAWRYLEGFDRDREIDGLMEAIEELADWATKGNPDDWIVKSLRKIASFLEDVHRFESVHGRDHDGLEARLRDLLHPRTDKNHWTWVGGRATPTFPKEEIKTRRAEVHARLQRFVEDAGADLAPRLRDELMPLVGEYEAAKAMAGCLDFTDLLIRARDLVRDHHDVRRELQQRLGHIFVDEFQDTDPLQAEILTLLVAENPDVTDWRAARPVAGKLFVVADPKQSIYRFRRADVGLYQTVKRRLIECGGELVNLNVSFRSVPEIQRLVNAAFAPRMNGASETQARYVALLPAREDTPGQPAVVALPVPDPYSDYRRIVDWKIDESLPDVIAAFVYWLVRESGWTITERERPGTRVPVEPRHVCLLFRRFRSFGRDVTRPYVEALEARHLQHLLVGGSSFHEREEVEAIRNALLAIERSDDELALFATLRGPFFALSDAALLAYREHAHTLHPFRPTPDDLPAALVQVADALAVFRDLHRGRNHRPVADTLGRLLQATRAHAGVANWPAGIQALANLGRVADLARRAERRGLTSFRAFVDRLEEEADRADAGDAPVVEEGVEGVRIMTIHKAKGLEFPVVILADMTAKETMEQPSRWVDGERRLCVMRIAGCIPPELLEHAAEEREREREEAVRALYVAATRARDLLVAPVIGDERREGWIAVLNPALYPDVATAHAPETSEPPGCPAFGPDSVPARPAGVSRPFGSVSPGLHRPERGEHRVVWWDPTRLELGVKETVGLARHRILETDESGSRSEEGLSAYRAWKDQRVRVRAAASAPSLDVTSATVRVEDETIESGEATVESVAAAGTRPRGPRFGALVHAVLAQVGLDDEPTAVQGHAMLQARLLGATDGEIEAASLAAVEALSHPVLRRAANAARHGRCRRETPIVLRLEGGALVECVADLAFAEDDGSWTVVDFKTDAEMDGRLERYRRQVALYARGVGEATGAPVRAVLLQV